MHLVFQLLSIIQQWEVIISCTLYMKMMRAFRMKAKRGERGCVGGGDCYHQMQTRTYACSRLPGNTRWAPAYVNTGLTDPRIQMHTYNPADENLPLTPHRDQGSEARGKNRKLFCPRRGGNFFIVNASTQALDQTMMSLLRGLSLLQLSTCTAVQ